MRMLVLLDTNLLLVPHQFGVDVFSEVERLVPEEHEVVTLSNVIEELRNLVDSSKDGVAAGVGLQLVQDKGVRIIPSTGVVDDCIIEYASGNDVVVGTNDRQLKGRLRSVGVQVLCMRGRDHLARQ